MRIKNISLKNYRNIETGNIDFSDGINILIGENANGKTNAVEAVYQFAQGKSFRTKNNAEVIGFGKDMCDLEIGFVNDIKPPPSADGTPFTKEGEDLDALFRKEGGSAEPGVLMMDATTSVTYIEQIADPIPVAYEGELISGGGFGIDDTLPLPFGYDAPPNVDFTMYTFGFEHTPPLNGAVTSRFGYRTHPVQGDPMFHYGIDISANTGTNIHSFAAGTVVSTGKSNTYGNFVLISHKDGVSSFYAHCSRILVKPGAKVEMGQVIALSGNTGASTGPHLHFELRLNDKLIDPEFYLWDGS
jgi:murein DD-endopeptidase MepM/ murein hydrolase activator NlpD